MKHVLLLALALASCGSPQTHFYTLTVQPSAAPAKGPDDARAGCGGTVVEARRVLLPGVLDRAALVRGRGNGELDVSGQDRWAGPLARMITRVLAEDLRDRLGTDRVQAPGDPTPAKGSRAIDVNVLRFMAENDSKVVLQADWALLGTQGSPLLQRSESVSEPAGDDAAADVTAMSGALGLLADRIAVAVAQCGS